MAAVEQGRALSRWAGIGLVACALGFAAFYALLFRRDNAAPVVAGAAVATPAPGAFLYATERCVVDDEHLRVQGWAIRKGHGWPIGGNRVVLRLADGRLRALDTAWQARPQLAPLLKARTGEKRTYYAPGFGASLNLRVAGVPLQGARLLLDWRAGDRHALLPLDCARLSP